MSFSVMLGDTSSSHESLFFGVTQQSMLGPLLFTIYFRQIIHTHNIDLYCYADNMQLYVSIKSGTTNVSCIVSCLTEITLEDQKFPAVQ